MRCPKPTWLWLAKRSEIGVGVEWWLSASAKAQNVVVAAVVGFRCLKKD